MRNTTNCYANKLYERTAKGMTYRIYYDQCYSSKTRGHTPPTYTKEELYTWITSQPGFNLLYQAWVDSNYTSDFKPSCDRLDNSKGYTFDNLELVSWKVNKERAYADTVKGTLGTCQKPVYQYALDGTFLASFISVNAAAAASSTFDHRNIAACCRGELPTAYKHYWSFENLGPSIPPIEHRESYTKTIYKYCPYTGDIQGIFTTLDEITKDVHKQTNLRYAIRNQKHWNFSYYSFEYLSPKDLLTRYGVPKQKFISVYLNGDYIDTFPSANKAKAATSVSDTIITKYCQTKQRHTSGYEFRFAYEPY